MKKIYPLDLAESYGFGTAFARGRIIDIIAKLSYSTDGFQDLKQAAWYLARLIVLAQGKNAAVQILESFKDGIDHE